MTIALREKVEGIRKVLKIYDRLAGRLPNTYPRASLVVHMSEEELLEYFFVFYECTPKEREGYPPYAFCDANSNTIHVHATMSELTGKKIAWYLLHELGHLRAFQRYGEHDLRADDKDNKVDELYANRFASRWIRRLATEEFFK